MNSIKRGLFLLIIFSFYSCIHNSPKQKVASVNDKDLFLSNIIEAMPKNTIDTTFFIQQYMNDWIRKTLMIYYAEMNLSSDMQNYEKQIEDYKSSLLIYAYHQQLLSQNFDTTVSRESIINYYNQYIKEFKLNNNIFKGRYIVVDRFAPKLTRLSNWYKSNNQEVVTSLKDYCQQFAKDYYLADTSWQYFSIINEQLPKKITNEANFLKNTKATYFEDSHYRYYVYIKDYKIKGSISPLAFEEKKIHNLLLNKNKIEYLQKLEDELYQNAVDLKKIKIYYE